jgi:hypothetical protein
LDPISKSPFSRYDVFYQNQVDLDAVDYFICFGVWFVELKEIMADPGESKPKNWHINHLEDIECQ